MKSLPSDGLQGLKENWRSEVLSGFLVFLIALPLCLGIALASGVPPLSGIIAAVVGGLVVSQISGSSVTINGPAAGLIVVILAAVESLSLPQDLMAGYRATLAATVIAGLIQVAMGLSRAGRLSSFFPSSAVHGLLASIGIILMVKQSYVMLGLKPMGKTALEQLLRLPASLPNFNPEIAAIGLASLATVIVLPRIAALRKVPAPLVAVLLGMGMGAWFDLSHEHTYVAFVNHSYKLGPDFLVTLPGRLSDGIVTPDWSRLGEWAFWKAVMMIAIIASLETLLSAAAVDKLDPFQRKTDLNRDLTAIGVGTAVSGMIGGLPMIAEIVRSSANINNGARTRWANFFHGAFMLVFVCALPGLIHKIPLASLAALLCYTGFRLASPREFRKTYEVGSDQLLIFVTTIVVTLGTDLLIGISSGVLVKAILHLRRGVDPRGLVRCAVDIAVESQQATCRCDGSLTFANLLRLQRQLEQLPAGLAVQIDLSGTRLVDHSSLEYLEHFRHDYQRTGGSVELRGLEEHRAVSEHPLAARVRRAS